jgi:hypothetical protein
MLMCGLLLVFGLLCHFRIAYLAGWFIILGCLVLEHWIARRRNLNWIQNAFFRLNAVISLVFLVVTLAEVVFKGGFKMQAPATHHSAPPSSQVPPATAALAWPESRTNQQSFILIL